MNTSIIAIDDALKFESFSFEEAHNRMRIANATMTDNLNLNYYNYKEANNYIELMDNNNIETVTFEKGEHKYIQSNSLNKLSCSYYQIASETPVLIKFESSNESLKFFTIIKYEDNDTYNIIDYKSVNIDPNIGIDWIKLLALRGNDNKINSEYVISIMDGVIEDFTFYPPYPNPSYSSDIVSFQIQIFKSQNFKLNVYDLLGRKVYGKKFKSTGSEIRNIDWNKQNYRGKK